MLKLFVISLFTISNGCAMSKNLYDLHSIEMSGITNNNSFYTNHNLEEERKKFHTLNYNNTNNNALFKNFVPFLLNLSMKLLKNVHDNVKSNYGLSTADIKILGDAFRSSKLEYQLILKDNTKKMMNNIKYNSPEILLLDFTDFSNYLLQTIVQNHLDKASGKLLQPTKWYKYLVKYSILRQQMKIVINVIEINICYKFSICVRKSNYTEYLIEWLRHLLNSDNVKLKTLFHEIYHVLNNDLHNITTNARFLQKIDKIVKSGSNYQRSAIDFLDEVISEPDIIKVVNKELRKYVLLLKKIFEVIDENYQLNNFNEKRLEDLSKQLWLWGEGEKEEIRTAFKDIVDNMWRNVQMWPIEVQTNLQNIGTKILSLE